MAKQGKSTKKVKNAVVDTQQTVVDNHQEQQGITNEEWKERLLTVNGNVVKLKHKSLIGKNPGTQEYSFEPEELPLEKNLKLKPEKIGGEIKADGEVFSYTNNANIQDDKEQTIRYLSMGGTVDVEIPGLEKQTINLQSTCIVMPPGENGEIFLLFRDPLVSELKDDKKFKLELNRGRYVKFPGADNGTMYFQGSNVYYKDNLIAENVWLECDQNGLHMNEEGELSLNQDKLDEEAWNGFDQKGEIVLEFAKTGPYVGMVTWEEGEELVTYETLDGIAEIIDVDYDSDSNTGTGDLLLHDFLVKYSNINVKLPVHSDDKKLEGVKVTYSGKEDDLINVEPKKACAHIKYRFSMEKVMGRQTPYGKGVGVLMYGPPGTGKTMAAQVMANELGMELCRVDLSQVTSKYIGETEKNLESVFREAEHSNVILFFDEADSLFGKRTEVKDSNDKYANQETSYILQRIESYEGMVVLATNLVKNFDSAFMRRITVSIRFSEPNEEMRRFLWKDMLQNTALAEDEVLIENLAKQFEITGSNIKSIVRNAVFMSFMEKRELHIQDLVKAIKVEFEKLGKICNAASFGMFMGYLN